MPGEDGTPLGIARRTRQEETRPLILGDPHSRQEIE
jgi:hypothetical protein